MAEYRATEQKLVRLTAMVPTTSKRFTVRSASQAKAKDGFTSLVLEIDTPIPPMGENDVLIRIRAVSLNFRDVMIASGTYIWPTRDGTVPCSDGAGEVVATGSKVTRFMKGDRVAATFHQSHLMGSLQPRDLETGLGAEMDGTLREYAVFNEQGLVSVPEHLSWDEATTLPCAGVTAWNALMGGGRPLQAGDTVVTQGTGAVSLFAVQFAIAAGARVISTTSSQDKADVLRKLGVHQVISYRETPDWGVRAKALTPGGLGADFVIEIGGPETIEQSLKAVRIDGIVATVGQRSGQAGAKSGKEILITDAFRYPCTIRRVLLGSREQFQEMNRSVAVNKICPVVDKRVFAFEEAPKALTHLWEQKHVGNVVVRVA